MILRIVLGIVCVAGFYACYMAAKIKRERRNTESKAHQQRPTH